MPSNTGSILGNYAPAMQEPYGIESTLAKEATGGSSALASRMLNSYWLERQGREAQYANRLADQMAFGQQYLQQQQADTALRTMPEMAKAGLLPATSGIYTNLMPGLNQAGLQQAADQATQNMQATNVGNAGRGIGAMGNVGINVSPGDISGLTGLQNITQGDPVQVAAAKIRAAGQVQAANARAAAGGGGGSASVTGVPDPTIGGQSIHRSLPKGSANWTDDQIRDYLRARGAGGSAANTGAPPPPVVGTTNLQPAPALPMAKTDTPANAAPALTQQSNKPPPPGTDLSTYPGGAQVLSAVKARIAQMPPDQQKSYGNNVTIKMGSDGKPHVFDSSGNDRFPVGR